jgi:hypothetical protein
MSYKAKLPNVNCTTFPKQAKKYPIYTKNMSHLTGFNNLFDKYLSKLIEWNPELTDLQTLKTGAELVRKYNPRAILIQFMDLVSPYYVHIQMILITNKLLNT